MTILTVLLVLIVLLNGYFAATFVSDLLKNKEEAINEPGNPIAMAIAHFSSSCFQHLAFQTSVFQQRFTLN